MVFDLKSTRPGTHAPERPAASRSSRARPSDRAALIAFWTTLSAFAIHEICSLDIWWQVTIGTDILESFRIPTTDIYSALGMGRPYHDSHWLFQVLLAGAHRLFGMVGVELVMVSFLVAVFAVCYRACRRWIGIFGASLIVFVAAMASVERFLPRPELVTFLGIAIFYERLQNQRFHSARDLALLAAVQIAWANSHGLFVIGPFMVGCHLLAALVRRIRARDAEIWPLTRALGITSAATLLTPFGLGGWRYAALLVTEVGSGAPDIMRDLGELSATFGAAARSSPAFWFYLVLVCLTAAAVIRSLVRREVSGGLLIVLAMAAASLTGRRNIVLLALVAAPFISEQISTIRLFRTGAPEWMRWGTAALMAGYAFFPLTGAYYLHMEIPARWGFGVTPSFFPHGLPAALDEMRFEGQILNSNTLGGFYAYHGFPNRLPLTDGRWEIHEPQVVQEVVGKTRSADGWRSVVSQFDITGILLAHTSPEAKVLLPEMRSASDWKLVYYDAAASFWVPADLAGSPPPVRLDRNDVPAVLRLDDALILNSFFIGVDAPAVRAAILERALDFGPRRKMLLEQLGPVYVQIGRYDDAEKTFTDLLDEDPNHAAAYNELAFLAYRKGGLRRARELMVRAIELDPENDEFRSNLVRVEEALRKSVGTAGDAR